MIIIIRYMISHKLMQAGGMPILFVSWTKFKLFVSERHFVIIKILTS